MVYFFTKNSWGAIFYYYYLKKVIGKENIPKDFKFIVAANHSSFMDDFLLPTSILKSMNKRFRIFVNSRFFKNKFLSWSLFRNGCIPVAVAKDVTDIRQRKSMNNRAFDEAIKAIKGPDIFAIFPEGGRSIDGTLKKAKTGVARLALIAKVPVVPFGIKGSYEIMPKGSKFPKMKRAVVIIGKPLYFDKYYGKEDDIETLEEVTTIIMKAIGDLIGQKYEF